MLARGTHCGSGGGGSNSGGHNAAQLQSGSMCAASATNLAVSSSGGGGGKCSQQRAAPGGFGSLIGYAGSADRSGSGANTATSRSASLSGKSSSSTWFEDHLDFVDPRYDLERATHDHLAFQGSQEQPQLHLAAQLPAAAAEQQGIRQPPEQSSCRATEAPAATTRH